MFFSRIDLSTRTSWCCTGAASMSSQKKARGLPGMKELQLVQMLDRQRVQQAAADEAKKLVDAAALTAERLVDATKEAEETATAAAAAAALSPPEEAQHVWRGSRGVSLGRTLQGFTSTTQRERVSSATVARNA
jgi:23S rRNA G2069 N7-methylase RlmK/C1962 C5-methylase RlmI